MIEKGSYLTATNQGTRRDAVERIMRHLDALRAAPVYATIPIVNAAT